MISYLRYLDEDFNEHLAGKLLDPTTMLVQPRGAITGTLNEAISSFIVPNDMSKKVVSDEPNSEIAELENIHAVHAMHVHVAVG